MSITTEQKFPEPLLQPMFDRTFKSLLIFREQFRASLSNYSKPHDHYKEWHGSTFLPLESEERLAISS
jgi:hypothetical protein